MRFQSRYVLLSMVSLPTVSATPTCILPHPHAYCHTHMHTATPTYILPHPYAYCHTHVHTATPTYILSHPHAYCHTHIHTATPICILPHVHPHMTRGCHSHRLYSSARDRGQTRSQRSKHKTGWRSTVKAFKTLVKVNGQELICCQEVI